MPMILSCFSMHALAGAPSTNAGLARSAAAAATTQWPLEPPTESGAASCCRAITQPSSRPSTPTCASNSTNGVVKNLGTHRLPHCLTATRPRPLLNPATKTSPLQVFSIDFRNLVDKVVGRAVPIGWAGRIWGPRHVMTSRLPKPVRQAVDDIASEVGFDCTEHLADVIAVRIGRSGLARHVNTEVLQLVI